MSGKAQRFTAVDEDSLCGLIQALDPFQFPAVPTRSVLNEWPLLLGSAAGVIHTALVWVLAVSSI